MDMEMIELLFVEWRNFELHKNLHRLDEIREGKELQPSASRHQMEHIDHDDYLTPTPPSSTDSVDG
jgi:hypothetical protein